MMMIDDDDGGVDLSDVDVLILWMRIIIKSPNVFCHYRKYFVNFQQ